ncbi:hypothetical protein AV530_010534 [Patagioenas fasciata monilis]|uniref:Uncharacterized protein n=1 Tax=Patagioenas fasciata monilis TaxID=372326 RepID=A0A1V4KFC6_PATFA|nr:hypothetical protein AV530_010534 [Patagioenas fasciata monilis]
MPDKQLCSVAEDLQEAEKQATAIYAAYERNSFVHFFFVQLPCLSFLAVPKRLEIMAFNTDTAEWLAT